LRQCTRTADSTWIQLGLCDIRVDPGEVQFVGDEEDQHANGAKTDIPTSLAFGWTAKEDLRRFLGGFPQRSCAEYVRLLV